jgi:hypothetical protein
LSGKSGTAVGSSCKGVPLASPGRNRARSELVHHLRMTWLPPWRFAARLEWANAHPWIAGCYFGAVVSVLAFFLPVLMGASLSLTWRIVASAVTGPECAVSFAFAFKRRWAQRPDAEAFTPPTWRRMWSRSSDRFLLWWMWLWAAGAVLMATLLISGSFRPWGPALAMPIALWNATTAWLERKRRRAGSQ